MHLILIFWWVFKSAIIVSLSAKYLSSLDKFSFPQSIFSNNKKPFLKPYSAESFFLACSHSCWLNITDRTMKVWQKIPLSLCFLALLNQSSNYESIKFSQTFSKYYSTMGPSTTNLFSLQKHAWYLKTILNWPVVCPIQTLFKAWH